MAQDTTYVRSDLSFPDAQRSLSLVVLAAVAVVALYWPTSAWLASEWSSSNALFEHGFLTVAVAAVLLVHATRSIPHDALQPTWLAAGGVLVLSIAWLAASVANVAIVQSLLLPLLLLCTLVTILGYRAGRVLAPAVLYVVFSLPVWEVLKPVLRDLTIVLVEAFLKIGGVPTVIEGSLVHIPAGVFRIASGCSGLNFFVVGLAIAALFGYVFYTSNAKRILLLVLGAAVAMLANWIRVASIIAIGNASDMKSELVDDHQMFGWIIFVVALVPFFVIASWLGRAEPLGREVAAHPWSGPRVPSNSLVAAVAALVLLAVGPVWAKLAQPEYAPGATARVNLPFGVEGWEGPMMAGSLWRPEYLGVSGEALGRYESEDGPVWMYGNVYLSQDQGSELVYIHNRIGGDALVSGIATRKMATGDNGEFVVRMLDVDEGYRTRRIMFWYEINERRLATDLRAKLHQAAAVLSGRPEAGVVAVSALCGLDCAEADARITGFIAALGSSYQLEYSVMDDGSK